MKGLIRYIFDLINSKTAKSLLMGMLIILCLLSSCSIRKGIALFFSDQPGATLVLNKAAKSSSIKNLTPEYNAAACELTTQGLDDQQLTVKQASPSMAMLPLLFLVLPEFLVSLLIGRKTPTALPVPNSWLRWSFLPLFLQNRLLLI